MKYLKISSAVLICLLNCTQCRSQRSEELTLAFFKAESILFKDQDPKRALQLVDSLLAIDQTACRGYWVKGTCHKDLREYERALLAFKKGIRCRPESYMNTIDAGDMFFKLGQLDSSEIYFLKALELEPDEPMVYYNLGVVYRANKHYLLAIDYLTNCIELRPIDDVYYLRSDSYFMVYKAERAYRDIKTHFKLNPMDYRALVLKGEILNELGNYKESIEALSSYLTNPTNQGENYVNFMIGLNYHQLNEFEKSCDYLKEAENLGYEDKMLTELLQNCNP